MKRKKKSILILILIFAVGLIALLLLKNDYTVVVEKIDDFSPDRRLIVYKNTKKIEFKELNYKDGVYLCSGENPTVSYSEIINEKELTVKINNKKKVLAKIVEK